MMAYIELLMICLLIVVIWLQRDFIKDLKLLNKNNIDEIKRSYRSYDKLVEDILNNHNKTK